MLCPQCGSELYRPQKNSAYIVCPNCNWKDVSCPICGAGAESFVKTPFLTCTNCGFVSSDPAVSTDSEYNFSFQDEWNEKARRIAKKWRKSRKGITQSKKSDTRTAALVKQHLIDVLIEKKKYVWAQLVKENCKPTSVSDLFDSFIYVCVLRIKDAYVNYYAEACRRACVRFEPKIKNRYQKTEKIKGTDKKIVKPRNEKIRRNRSRRKAIIEKQYYRVRKIYGEEIEKITRFLAKYIRPEEPLATAEAVAIYLGIVKKKKIRKIVKERLEKLKAFLNKPLPLLVINALNNGFDKEEALEILSELKRVKNESMKRAARPSYLKYYSWMNHEGGIKLHPQNCTKIQDLAIELKDPYELVKYYITYGEYVKACRKFGVEPLSYERFLRRKWILSIPRDVIRKALEEIASKKRRKIGEDFRELPPLSA